MSGPDYHAWTHRLKSQGGTDPISMPLSWCEASNTGVQQVVTTTDELDFNQVRTNDDDTFRWDPDDPSGILIYTPGMYLFFSSVRYLSGSAAVSRSVYQSCQPLSSGPDLFGNELGETSFSMGQGQTLTGVGEAPGPSSSTKSNLQHLAQGFQGNSPDPSRFVVVLEHRGTDYTVGNLPSASFIVKVANILDTPDIHSALGPKVFA